MNALKIIEIAQSEFVSIGCPTASRVQGVRFFGHESFEV